MGKNDNSDDSDPQLEKEKKKYKDGHTLAKFNEMIKKAQGILTCGPKCQKEKGKNNLREKYLEAKQNYFNGPEQIEHTFKNYYVYENGEQAYNEEHQQIVERKAAAIIQQYVQSFQENIDNSKILLESYTALLINYQNVSDYYNELMNENAGLKKKLKDMQADIVTNDRKTYYEDQGIESLNFYSFIFMIIYIAILLGYVVCMMFKPSDFSFGKKIAILVFLILYFFFATPLFLFIIDFLKKVSEMLPKNIYKSL